MDAADRIDRVQQYSSDRFYKKSRPPKTYEPGELVILRNIDTTQGSNKKFVPLYRGPYTIHKYLGSDRCVLRDPEGMKHKQLPYDGVVEAHRLRPWGTPEPDTTQV